MYFPLFPLLSIPGTITYCLLSGTNMKRKLHGCLKLCLHCKPVFQCSFALMALLMLQCKQREGRGVFSWCHLYRSDSNCGRELTTAKYSGMVTTPQSLLSLSAVLFCWTKMCLKSTFSLKKKIRALHRSTINPQGASWHQA